MTVPTTESASPTPGHRSWLRAIFRTQEGMIFLVGVSCLIAILLWALECTEFSPRKAGTMLGIVPAHVTGGRASGIAIALASKQFSPLEVIVLATLIESMVVCLFFSAFCLTMKKMVHAPWLHNAMRDVHESAKNQRHLVARWGILALILFVWFPFMMTGPVVGTVIGHLMGLRYWVTLGTVMAGTLAAIICWTYLMDQMTNLMHKAGSVAPILGVAVIVATIIVIRLRSYRKAVTRPPAHGPDETTSQG
jgi:uncharacterized membrane protein